MSLPLIGVTMGDPTGVGPEIIVKALAKEEPFQACRPLVFGDQGVLLKAIKDLGVDVTVEVFDRVPEEGYRPGNICLFPSSHLHAESLQIGKPDRECGEAMVNSIRLAVQWVMLGRIDAVTTCPINKQAINRAGYSFSGHTELLAHLTRTESVAMMFVGTKWKVVLVTTHLPLGEVPKWITEERVLNTIQMTDRGMKRHFGISLPRIAVLGLNPHGGEEGLLGKEEEAEIVPAIKRARALAVEVEGPFPADSFFDASRSPITMPSSQCTMIRASFPSRYSDLWRPSILLWGCLLFEHPLPTGQLTISPDREWLTRATSSKPWLWLLTYQN